MESGWWGGHKRAAVFAGPQRLITVKFVVHLRHGVGAIVTHGHLDFIDLLLAGLAKPDEAVLLPRAPFALKDDKPRIIGNSGRMRHAAWTKQHLSRPDDGDSLFPFGGDVVKMLLATELQSHLVARIYVEVESLLAPTAQERERFRVLP